MTPPGGTSREKRKILTAKARSHEESSPRDAFVPSCLRGCFFLGLGWPPDGQLRRKKILLFLKKKKQKDF